MCLKKEEKHRLLNLKDTVYNVNKSLLIIHPFIFLKKLLHVMIHSLMLGSTMLSPDLINSHSQVRDPEPLAPLLFGIHQLCIIC